MLSVRMGVVGIMAAAAVWLIAVPGAQAAPPPPLGALTQLPGNAGCFSDDGTTTNVGGTGTCAVGRALGAPESVTVSPDGRFVYVGAYASVSKSQGPSLTVFSRNLKTGVLTQLSGKPGCLTSDGSSGACTAIRGLRTYPGDGRDLVITSDGKWAYFAVSEAFNLNQGAVILFSRNPTTGVLRQLAGKAGCITADGSSQAGAGTCRTDPALSEPMGVSLSPGGKFLYVTDYGQTNRIHVFARNTRSGALTDVQCLSEATAPPGCTADRVLGNSQSIVFTPDGRHAYSGDFQDGIAVFDRNPATGKLTQKAGAAGCITDNGGDDTGASTCTAGRVLGGAYPLTISPDGHTLYVPAGQDNGVAIFHINPNGSLTQRSGPAGCITETGQDQNGGTCSSGKGVEGPYGAAISPDGRTLYVGSDKISTSFPGAVAVFSLDPSTGHATQLPGLNGCVSDGGVDNGSSGACANGRGLAYAYGVTVSPDGRSVYVAGNNGSLAIFARETAPVCRPVQASTVKGKAVTVHLACTDADGQPVKILIASKPAHGRLSAVNQANQTATYTPAAAFNGTDRFTIKASDGTNSSAPATVTVKVTA